MRFGNKIFLTFMVFFAVGLVATHLMRSFGIPGTSHRGTLQEEEQHILNDLRLCAEFKIAHVREFLGERQHDLTVAAKNIAVQESLEYLSDSRLTQDFTAHGIRMTQWGQALYQTIVRLQGSHPRYRDIAVWEGSTGRIFIASEGSVVIEGMPVELMVRQQADQNIQEFIEFYVSPITRTHYLVLSRRLMPADATPNASRQPLFVSVFLEVEEVLSRLLAAEYGDAHPPETILVDTRLQIVAHYRAPASEPGERLLPVLRKVMGNHQEINGIDRDAGGNRLLVAARYFEVNKDTGLGLAVLRDYRDVLATLWRRNIVNIGIGLLGTIFLLGVSLLVTRPFIRPLLDLSQIAQNVRRGDLSTRARVKSRDEVGVLARTFNDMLDSLESSHRELESRVEQRTEQLSGLNRQLQVEIEERRDAERQVQESRDSYQRIADNVPGVLYQLVQNKDGTMFFPFIAEGCRVVFGVSADEIRQDPYKLLGFINPDDRPGFYLSLRHSAETLQKWTWESKLTVREEDVWVRCIAQPQRQANGDTVWDGLIIDITEPKRLLLELGQTNSVLNAIFEGTTDALYAKNDQRQYIRINSAGATMLGKLPGEIIGHTDDDFLSAEQASRVEEVDCFVLTHDEPVTFEEQLSVCGEERFFLTTKNTYHDELGNVIGLIGIRRDITERKKAEERHRSLAVTAATAEVEHRKAEELKAAYDQLKYMQTQLVEAEKLSGIGQLAAGVAHELNSPLAGLLSLLRMYHKKEQADTQTQDDFAIMLEACEHMARIVRDLTSFARQSKGEIALLSMNDVIQSTLRFGHILLTKNKIKVVSDYAAQLGHIQGNKSQLQQVVLNIISNARDAMPDGGTFTIRTYMEQDPERVVAEFTDTGCGMSEDVQQRIFEPFFTTKGPGRGVGLGMSVSHGIITDHNGEISVASALQQGTTFRISLPVGKAV